jgi:type II secretory pathway pseudopilin PulG
LHRSLSGPPVLQHFQTALPQRVSSSEGFSLISLLVVLVVMWVLSYVVVGSCFSLSLAGDTL